MSTAYMFATQHTHVCNTNIGNTHFYSTNLPIYYAEYSIHVYTIYLSLVEAIRANVSISLAQP